MTEEEKELIDKNTRVPNSGSFYGGMTMFKCPVCQKDFCIHDLNQWVYKRKRYFKSKNYSREKIVLLYLCSYGCTRKYDHVFE